MSCNKKTVKIGQATLYHGNAWDILPDLGNVDALITDPPYSSGGFTRGDKMRSTKAKYVGTTQAAHNVDFTGDNRDSRSWAYWLTSVLSQAHELTREGAYAMVFSDWRQLPTLTDIYQAAGFVWRGLVVWDKTQSSRAPHTGYFRHQSEYVVWGSKGALGKSSWGGPHAGVITQRVNPHLKLHMTGKPIEVMNHLIKALPPGSTVLDPFMGSGTTGIAALAAGHRFIGIELSEHYFNVACERFRTAKNGA